MCYGLFSIHHGGDYYLKYPVGGVGTNNYKVPIFNSALTYMGNISGTYVSGSGNDTIIKVTISDSYYNSGYSVIGYNQSLTKIDDNDMIVEDLYPEEYIPYNDFFTKNDFMLYSDQIIERNPFKYVGEEARIFTKGFFAGDSLTKGTFNRKENGATIWEVIQKYSYPTYFGKMYGCAVANWGIGGEDTKSWYELVSQDTRATDYDFAVIALGANDIRLDDIAVSKDYYQRIINMFKSDVNNVKIFCCTVTPAYTETNPTFYNDYNDMVREIATENTNCYLIDLAKYSVCHKDTVYAQGHLTALGYMTQAREIGNAISYIIHNYSRDFKDIQFIGTDWHYD